MLEQHEHEHAVHEFDGIIENRISSPPVYFTILFYGLILWGVAFCAYYLLSGWSSEAEFQQKMAIYEDSFQKAETTIPDPKHATPAEPSNDKAMTSIAVADKLDGATLYAQNCAMCHGDNAKGGGIGPDLTAETYDYGKTPEDITASIASGREGGMPAFETRLKTSEIQALVEYLLSL